MGLFRRLIGKDRRDRKRQQAALGADSPFDPTFATFLPDWSEEWIATTREQAAGPIHPRNSHEAAAAAGDGGLGDTAGPTAAYPAEPSVGEPSVGEPSVGESASPATWPSGGYLTVDLTPPEFRTAEAWPAGTSFAEGWPTEPAVIDHVPAGEPHVEPGAPAGAGGADTMPAYDQRAFGEIPGPPPSVAPLTGEALVGLPPPAAGSVVLDLPAPPYPSPAQEPPAAAVAVPLVAGDESAVPVPQDESALPAAAVAVPLVAGDESAVLVPPDESDDLVLDVRDSSVNRGEPVPVPSHVVLGFGDGSQQQLAGDDPDVRTFHELAAALTSAPRHRA